jgi:hypothetical protein
MREQGPSAPDLPVPWLARYPRVGQFLRKLMDDRVPNLAVLLAWGALATAYKMLGRLARSVPR